MEAFLKTELKFCDRVPHHPSPFSGRVARAEAIAERESGGDCRALQQGTPHPAARCARVHPRRRRGGMTVAPRVRSLKPACPARAIRSRNAVLILGARHVYRRVTEIPVE